MTPAPARVLPAPTLWALFSCALAALATVWLPLSVLQLIDGLLYIERPFEIARDLALLWPMAAAPALVFAVLAWLVWRTTGSRHTLLAWLLLLVPVTWLCVWQFARTLWLWLKVMAGTTYIVSPELRLGVVAVLGVAVVTIVWRRDVARRLAGWLTTQLRALRGPAFASIGVALAITVVWPPKLLGAHRVPLGPLAAAGNSRPDIYLVSIDTLAAEDASACGTTPTLMPNLRRIAQQAHCFSRYYATANFTTPTTSSMETGALPWAHLAVQPDAKIIDALRQPSLASVLRSQGYLTYSVTDNLLASPRHRGTHGGYEVADLARTTLAGNAFRDAMTTFPDTGLPQLAAAAMSFLGAFDVHLHGEQSPYESERVYEAAQSIIAANADQRRPLFVWAHTLPPHSPYLPPPSTKYQLLGRGELERWQDLLPDNIYYTSERQPLVDKHRLRYRESMMAADAALGVFLDRLEREGRLDKAILVVTADHGESFEHGYIGHAGPNLHESLIRIPLLIRLPGQKVGRVIDMPVSQADLAPTLLSLAAAPALPTAQGRSLVPLLDGSAALAPVPVFAMSLERQSRFRALGDEGHFAVIDGANKLVSTLGRQAPLLYDLAADPSEQVDLATQMPDRVAALEALLRERLARAETARRQRLTR